MKKIITKFWGVALIVVLLSTLFVTAPVSAADPLNWEMKVDAPSGMFALLSPGATIVDYAVSPDGMTLYAITRAYGTLVITTTAAYAPGVDTIGETYTFTYTNEQGIAGQIGTITVPATLATATAVTYALAAGDFGVSNIDNVNLTRVVGDSATGGFTFDVGLTNLATCTVAGVITDGVANPPVDSLRQATTGGGMWTNITARLGAFLNNLDYVTMAPDSTNFVVVGDATPVAGVGAMITTDGGATFSSMGIIQNGAGAVPCTGIRGIEISAPVTGGIRYIAVYGTAGANLPGLYYYNYGPGVGSWHNACIAAAATDFVAAPINGAGVGTYDNVVAFKFSANFQADFMGVAEMQEDTAGAGDITDLHILSFNSRSWDTAIATNYPVSTYVSIGALVIAKADLALSPDYDGADESLRIAFLSAAWADAGAVPDDGGVFRHVDNVPVSRIFGTATSTTAVNSVAFDGTTLVAGSYDTNNVFRSVDPMATAPTFMSARNLKRIGLDAAAVNDMVNVTYAGETLFGSKQGTAGALSKSTDSGNTWNDFTLLNSALTVIDDIYMMDDMNWYLASHDTATSAVFKISFFAVTRVLVVANAGGNPDFMLRGTAADGNVVYAADELGTTLYYTADGGLQRWFQRAAVPAAINDLAVESAQVIYVGNAANVYKSTNAGFTWTTAINSRLSGANAVNSMVSLGENKLVIGGTGGGVVWTTDGGTTWFQAFGVMNTFGAVQVAASGLATGDYVFAAEEVGDQVWRCEVSPANFLGEFKSMNLATVVGDNNVGCIYRDGVLYVEVNRAGASITINRTLVPTVAGTHTAAMWSTPYNEAGIVPAINSATALRGISAGNMIVLYTVAPFFGAPTTFYYQDTVALAAPVLQGPADGYLVQIISPLTAALANVNFTWNRISLSTSYLLQVAMDAGFNEPIAVAAAGVVNSTADPVSSIQGGNLLVPGTTYYWRVRATLPITSAWSEVRSFTSQPSAASVPAISSPAIGTVIDNVHPAFSWSPVSGATKYKFELSKGITFAIPVFTTEATVAGAQLPAATNLERGATYFWRVKSLAPVESDWSTVANFVVAEEVAPPPPAPVPTTTQITITQPAATTNVITVPPAVTTEVNPAYIWAIIIIGAVLVLAVIVLIVRTRRSV